MPRLYLYGVSDMTAILLRQPEKDFKSFDSSEKSREQGTRASFGGLALEMWVREMEVPHV